MRSAGLFLVFAGLAAAQDWEGEARALRPADVSANEAAVLDEVQQRARQALDAISRAHTREQAESRRADLRRRLQHSLGYERLPWPPALHARIAGTMQRPGYRIEKIVYQALPGMDVPGHLYLPDNLAAPAPAVLHYTGHWWEDGKSDPDLQTFCATLARLGFVVFIFDTFGQGERGVSARDHRRVEALLAGISQQGFAEHETRCALQYLLSRREVDPARIGITGASGGGYNTWIHTALDDRIAAAVPVVGTSDFYEQLSVARPGDFWSHAGEHCHFVPGLLRYANNHELLALVAPKPLLIIAASKDSSFPIAGNLDVYRYGRELYRAWGAPERIGFYEDRSAGHGYQVRKREAAYGWFLRWLKHTGDGRPFPEPAFDPLPAGAPELRCFPAKQPSGPAMMAGIRRLADTIRPAGNVPRWSVDAPSARLSPAPVQRLVIRSEDLDIPGFLARASPQRGVVLALDDHGKEALTLDPAVRRLFAGGWSVCGIDPRGIGELAVIQNGWLSAVSLLLGDNYPQRQARDLARAGALFPGTPIAIYARGHHAALAAMYLLPNQPSLRWFILRDGFLSFRQFIDRPQSLPASFRLREKDGNRTTAYDREIPFAFFPFDALRSFDLPQLLSATPAPGLIINPINGDWERMSPSAARRFVPAAHRIAAGDDPGPAIAAFLEVFRR